MPTAATGLGFLLIGFLVLGVMSCSLAILGFWVWMLVECALYTPAENNLKLVWVLIIVLTGCIGALIFFFVQRPKDRVRQGYRP